MERLKKLAIVSLLAFCVMVPLGSTPAVEALGVCEDRRDFCLAGCTTFSPANCSTRCHDAYRLCKRAFGTDDQT